MAKLKNKINKKNNKVVNNVQVNKLKDTMQKQVADSEFVDAMDTLVEIIKVNGMDVDSMYLGAYCYMMTGDNDRAVKWIDNVLKLMPNHVKARILLGRICIMEDRNDDALNVFEFLLENMQDKLTQEEKDDLDELLDYYRYSDEDDLVKEYPHIAKFLGLTDEIAVEEREEEMEVEEKKEVDDPAQRARDAVARLKALLNSKKEADAAAMEQEAAKENVCSQDDVELQNAENDAESVADDGFDVEVVAQQIMNKPVSLKDKVKLFNTFAAGCYVNGDYQNAFELLSAALSIDPSEPNVLRNIAYVCAAAGEKEQAMEFVSKLPMVDFGVLKIIK